MPGAPDFDFEFFYSFGDIEIDIFHSAAEEWLPVLDEKSESRGTAVHYYRVAFTDFEDEQPLAGTLEGVGVFGSFYVEFFHQRIVGMPHCYFKVDRGIFAQGDPGEINFVTAGLRHVEQKGSTTPDAPCMRFVIFHIFAYRA